MKLIPFIVAALSVLTACDGNRASDWSQWRHKDALGLRFAVAPDRQVAAGDTIIVIRRAAPRRQIFGIEIYTVGGPDSIGLGDNRTVDSGETPAPFTVIDKGSGSGGTEYALLTSKRVADRTVKLFATIQTEDGVPSFAEAWAVWESLRVAP